MKYYNRIIFYVVARWMLKKDQCEMITTLAIISPLFLDFLKVF